jgi:hypothetical protein
LGGPEPYYRVYFLQLRHKTLPAGSAAGLVGEGELQVIASSVCPSAWDRHCACFDKLSMRLFLNAMKIVPHPEPVEGRTMFVQRC